MPAEVALWFVQAHEVDPPDEAAAAHWLLLTTHAAQSLSAARLITRFHRQRCIIEQLFRTMKTKGFDIEASQVEDGGPFENLATAVLIASVQVLQPGAADGTRARRGCPAPARRRVRPGGSARHGCHRRQAGRQDRTAEKPAPPRLAGLGKLDLRPSGRLELLLQQTRTHHRSPRPPPTEDIAPRLEPETRCVHREGSSPAMTGGVEGV